MILIFGLGNPGEEYHKTRHNIGHVLIEKLKNQDLFIDSVKLEINDGFMNESGSSLKKIASYYKIEPNDILIIHDDMDLEFGNIKLDYNRSSAGHHGVDDIIDKLKTQQFHRLRFGIGRNIKIPGDKYVLEKFSQDEEKKIEDIIDKTVDLLVKSDLLKDKLK